jgi:hypothetical protein
VSDDSRNCEVADLRRQLKETEEISSLALNTALAAVGAAAVALRALEPKAASFEERAVLERAKEMLLEAEKHVTEWLDAHDS